MKKVILLMLVLAGCTQGTKDKDEVKQNPLIGEWRNLTIRVEMDKKHGEPTSIFEANEATWEEKVRIKPIRTYFREDNTFNSEHFNLKDSLVLNPEGTWTATEGKMEMITLKPFSDTTSCTYSIAGDVITFGCWVDWDEDGKKDDWYVGTQKRYN